MKIVVTVLAATILILDLFGNATVIHVIRARTQARTTIDLLIANLAVADLLMIPVILYLVKFFFIQFDWFGGILGQITCRLAMSLQALSILGSVYTIFAISVDRFCAVFFPLQKILTKPRLGGCIVFIWLIAIAFAIPQGVIATVLAAGKKHVCVPVWENSGMKSSNYTLIFVVFSYIFPLVAIATLYTFTGARLWKSTAPGHHSEEIIKRMKATRRKPTKMLICIVVVFALCWLPLDTAEVLRRFTPEIYWRFIPFEVILILPWFGVANSAINPFIYPIFCEKFNFEFKRILGFYRSEKPNRKKSDLTIETGLLKWNDKKIEKSLFKLKDNEKSPHPRSTKIAFTTV